MRAPGPVLLLLAAALVAGCDSGGGDGPTTPSQPTVMVTAAPNPIAINGVSTVTATARTAAGAAVPAGSQIQFQTTFGTLDATTVLTDSAGVAVTKLRAPGSAGAATVTAALGGSGANASVRIDVGTAAAIVTVTPAAAAIAPAGQTTIDVRVRNGDGTPRANARAQLATTLGRLRDRDVVTDGGGFVRVGFDGAGQRGTAVITALLESGETGMGQIVLGNGFTLTLESGATAIPVDGSTAVRARVRTLAGAAAGAGLVVRLTTDLGRLADERPATNAFGVAETTLIADGRVGIATVEGDLDDAVAAAELTVQIGQGVNLTLVADPPDIDSDESTTLRMSLRRSNGAGVSGQEIVVVSSLGRLTQSRPVTDAQGNAATTLEGNGQPGIAVVTATVPGAGVSVTIRVPIL